MEKTISQKIIELRKAAGLTQEQLGEKLGISGQAVSKWERDESMPDILILPDLCDALGTTPNLLLGGKRAEDPRIMNKEFVVPGNDTLSICLEKDQNVLVSDPLGMGFVMSGTEFADNCLKMDDSRINKLIKLFTDENMLAVVKIIAKNTATVDEICAETGLEKPKVQEMLLDLSNCAVIAHGRDKNGKAGYSPASGMVAVWLVLAGCSLFDIEGIRANAWITV